jgi:hypothetical protein
VVGLVLSVIICAGLMNQQAEYIVLTNTAPIPNFPRGETMRVVDLFSGLGGFSQAFVDRGHEVTRVDNNSQFKDIDNTVIMDVGTLTPDIMGCPDIILTGFPCQHFSIAAVSHHWPKGEPTKKTIEMINLLKRTLWLIRETNPKYDILENPRGMMRNVLGKPAKSIFLGAWNKKNKKATDLWGKLPPVDWLLPHKWIEAKRGAKTGVQDPSLSAAERSLIPYEFSLAVCLAAEGNSPQQTLEAYV